MLDFLIDNIYVGCGGHIFQQVVVIPMGAYCAPLMIVPMESVSLHLYSDAYPSHNRLPDKIAQGQNRPDIVAQTK